ncbi:MAG: WYL domain-containing protein [Coriobacteriales bacterium]|nr:WYL domain-containing protein [Coriobacteriales bacterium]
MASGSTQKLKILYLMDILRAETDPDHGLTMPQLIERLAVRGINAERKGLYRDIETLRQFGLDIRPLKHQPVQYALVERDFELSQLMLLVDAVQSSKFLSNGASNALVKSIRQLASAEERKALNKQVHVHGRPKRQDQSDFVAVDLLQEAIVRKSKVSFRYYKYGATKERVARKGGAVHVATPINLTYSDGNYYLVAYSASDGGIRNYRVDRMGQIVITGKNADHNEVIASYDPEEAELTAFGMYDGERVVTTVKIDSDLMNVIVDRFGQDVDVTPSDDGETAIVTVPVRKSPVFFGWLATLGNGAEILRPKALRVDYANWLRQILGKYEEQQ